MRLFHALFVAYFIICVIKCMSSPRLKYISFKVEFSGLTDLLHIETKETQMFTYTLEFWQNQVPYASDSTY